MAGCGMAVEGVPGLNFLLSRDGIRVTGVIVDNRRVRTRSGVGIGSTDASVHRTYPGRVTTDPGPYLEGGRYLIFTSADTADRDFRLVFDSDGHRVRQFGAGILASLRECYGW